jgi:uncharacterized RDD family membrane protein YckC
MTAFGGALTDPTKIMGSRIGAYVIDFVLLWVVVIGALVLLDQGKFETVHAGTPAAAQQICNDINDDLRTNIDGEVVVEGDDRVCFATGDTARVATGDDFSQIQQHLWVGLVVVGLLNYVVLSTVAGGTVGKLLFGLRVVTMHGTRAGFGRNLLRWVLLIVDALCCYFLPGLIVASKSKGHRRIGDMAAGTYVVHRSAEGRLLHIPGHLHVKGRHEFGTFGPAPAAPEPTLGTGGGIDAPVFDPSRNTYVRYDQASGLWFQWDDVTQAWIPAQQ